METFGIADINADVFETISLFQPYDIDLTYKKIGPPRDGGYVMADTDSDFDLLSFGISNDVRFEQLLADRGIRCFMYDHTIDSLPSEHHNFHWQKLGVSGSYDETGELLSVASHLGRIEHSSKMVLKIDVEGAEWDVFSSIESADLEKFDQIVGEFHWLLELDNPDFRRKVKESMRKLNEKFTLFHVHANNCRPLGFTAGFPVADVLELSFVRTDLVTRSKSRRFFPGVEDKANNLAVGDHALLFYPFLPDSEGREAVAPLIRRIEGDRYTY